MPVFLAKIIDPAKTYWTATSTDESAVTKAKSKFTAAEWDKLGEEGQAPIVALYAASRNKATPTVELIGEMTGFLTTTTEQNKAVFEARKKAIQELLSAKDATVETVEQIKPKIAPASYKTLGQWLEGVEVSDAITKHITTKAAEASARNEAAKAASKSS